MYCEELFLKILPILFLITFANGVFAGAYSLPYTNYGSEFGAWTTDLNAARNLAASIDNYFIIYCEFSTESSTCSRCSDSQKAVFNTQQFYTWATDNKVALVYADYATKPSWQTILRDKKYLTERTVFPTIIFVDGKTDKTIKWFVFKDKDYADFLMLAPQPHACTPSTEVCDGIDNDCDGKIDEQKSTEVCDGIDNDCDGKIDQDLAKYPYYTDYDGDGFGAGTPIYACMRPQGAYVYYGTDCDDTNPLIKPNAEEPCDGIDNDCDQKVDDWSECAKGSTNCNLDCTFATRRSSICMGSVPTNATINSPDIKYSEKWNGTSWITTDNNTFINNTFPQDCAFKCDTNFVYVYSIKTCETSMINASCSGSLDSNSAWNDNGNNGVFAYPRSSTPQSKSAHYSQTPEDCAYKCKDGFHREGSKCLSDQKTAECTLTQGTLPNNAKWNSTTQQYFIQTWVTNSYSPSSKNAFYSENQEECAYGCAELTKECQPDPVMYCGSGQQDCNFGTWTACIPTSANICTTNQYCENNMCTFCFDTNKNCDSNLLNGCETNLLTNSENCGACGLRCNSGIDCVNGVCENNIIDVNLCESTFCGENSSCNPINGNCACAIGYYNCDEDGDNGCEKSSPCTIIPAYECILDSNCDSTEECKNGFCVSKPVVILPGHCENDSDCDTNESCISSTCQEVICGSGFTINNHSCRCTGEICNNTCYAEEGICCNNRWNKNLDSCLFETETISITVDASKNQDAIDLLEQAKSSIDSGEILKGKAQALTAELKALIETKNQPSYNEKYEEALLAIKEKDYEKATTISLETKEKLNESQNGGIEFYIMAFCAMVVVIGIIVGLFKIIQKK